MTNRSRCGAVPSKIYQKICFQILHGFGEDLFEFKESRVEESIWRNERGTILAPVTMDKNCIRCLKLIKAKLWLPVFLLLFIVEFSECSISGWIEFH